MIDGNSILLLQLSKFAVRNFFPSVSYFFSQFLRAGILCWEKVVQVWGKRPRICDLFKTLFLLERTGKQVKTLRKNFEHDTNLDNYSNRMFFLIFLELHLLDLCVDVAESFSKWLFNRSVWKIFLTCEEKYFSSHVMDFSVKKKIEVLTKRSQQVRNNKEN